MKQAKRLTALILAMLLCASYLPMVSAEESDALDALMADVARPETYEMALTPSPAEGSGAIEKTVNVNFTSADGQPALAVIALSFEHFTNLDATWQERAESYAEIVANAATIARIIEPGHFAGEVSKAIDNMHRYNEQLAQSELKEGDALPTAKVIRITVTSPNYETLQRGSRGDAVVRLQQKLIDLGFFSGKADGQFGPATAEGVKALQAHVRSLEQEQIDLMPEPTPLPAPTLAPTPTPAEGEALPAEDGPEAEIPQPTPIPVPKPDPATALDGIASSDLQAYLYSDSFSIASAKLASGDSGAPVLRLQNRLTQLGYMAGKADGSYGPNTDRAVLTFQYYNGLTQDAVATREMQQLLYSDKALRPPYPMLTSGSRGEEVRTLQRRLKLLGFMTGEVDGTYGASTVRGVKKLQEYLIDRERQRQARAAEEAAAALTPQPAPENQNDDVITQAFRYLAGGTALAEDMERPDTAAATLKIQVDGICDPLLQELFYAEDFPVIPETQKSGAQSLDVERIQRRLYDLEYMYSNPDGAYGDNTVYAIKEFQGRNNLTSDGIAGASTIKRLFSEEAKKALKPYVLKVSTDKQRVYAYAPDENEEYTRLVRTMKCSTGLPSTPTPKGTFQGGTGPGARWHYFKKFTVWAQYAYYIEGDIMFHSVLYPTKGGRVTSSSVNNLGRKASHGCVRLTVEDAKWIWNNCPRRTKIIVY